MMAESIAAAVVERSDVNVAPIIAAGVTFYAVFLAVAWRLERRRRSYRAPLPPTAERPDD